ncbi:hypothetical protein F4780DRAFT_532993 [Xylariomycetidae sp. FL0641]|nr:hypothetical protein F4780DRAFT_532993 [Xylariomycetidae sp. FL0641]
MAEVAGLVLAVVPIVITILEKYRHAQGPVFYFMKWEPARYQMVRSLRDAHVAHLQNVHLLLKGAVDNETMRVMVDDPTSSLWRNKDLVDHLRSRLGEAYEPSMETIREIGAIIVYIAKTLKIEGADQVTRFGLGGLIHAKKPSTDGSDPCADHDIRRRLSFVLRCRSAKRSLKQLEECNKKLANFVGNAERLHGEPDGTGIDIRFASSLETIQENADTVYRVLQRSFCGGKSDHQAGLLLEQRLQRRAYRKRTRPVPQSGDCQRFGISVFRSSAYGWIDTVFDFQDLHLPQQARTPRQPSVTLNLSNALQPHGQPEVTNICSAIETAKHPHLGFQVDSLETLSGLYEVQDPESTLHTEGKSLAEILTSGANKGLSVRDKYRLGITLVSSTIQLGKTPWLRHPWDKNDVIFLRAERDSASRVDVRHPYLSHVVSKQHPQRAPPRDNYNMLALAIMLIEIATGKPIEELRGPGDLGPDGAVNLATNYTTVKHQIDSILDEGNMSDGYYAAIDHCLACSRDFDFSFANPDFCGDLTRKVLQPLEEDLLSMFYRL